MKRQAWTRSLRARITFWSALVTAAILVVAGLAMLRYQRSQLIENTDQILRQSFDNLGNGGVAGGRVTRLNRLTDLEAILNSSDLALQLLDVDGNVGLSTPSLRSVDGPLVDIRQLLFVASGTGPLATQTEPFTVSNGGVRYRVIVGSYGRSETRQGFIVAAESLRDIDQALGVQAVVFLVSIPALIALLAGLIWLVVGRALKPVDAIRREVETISGDDLHRRVPVPTSSYEIEELATTMNGMLARLDESAETQRRFVDDASHELRSPIAGVRGLLEVNLSHPEVADWDESGREILGETIRMQHLVDDLMTLARGKAAGRRRQEQVLDLDDIVLAEGARLRRDTAHIVDLSGVSAAQVSGDEAELTSVVRNLVDNAARHAKSTIWLSLTEQGAHVELVVRDDGPGIDQSMAERVFERFARLDEARARDQGGSGLGLSIVKAIVGQHDGTISLDTSHRNGARFVVRLPAV